ncbi:hypothetical protein [Desulfovibrio subterraneus]|jgi:hypothetical protein|uniref:Uncharacterized protein n=1 Tax=Desulfovibrio subterraneus TaxID=2718620 RepID=A0A7J0BK64_9BACT|nr:hypothetical protein [Desulfovibrio subterraneus]GFM33968.1 hypothetical protein DSM101010T_23330 [Desulfovibrio subterraneus]
MRHTTGNTFAAIADSLMQAVVVLVVVVNVVVNVVVLHGVGASAM